jgi:hypothetical protein
VLHHISFYQQFMRVEAAACCALCRGVRTATCLKLAAYHVLLLLLLLLQDKHFSQPPLQQLQKASYAENHTFTKEVIKYGEMVQVRRRNQAAAVIKVSLV